MSVFKKEAETKRVIFNVRLDLAERLEKAKEDARMLGKKLDHEGVIDKALEKFLHKAERKLEELRLETDKKGSVIKTSRPCGDEMEIPEECDGDIEQDNEQNQDLE